MRNPAKAILVAILIAIPAPFVLGLLLTTTPEPPAPKRHQNRALRQPIGLGMASEARVQD